MQNGSGTTPSPPAAARSAGAADFAARTKGWLAPHRWPLTVLLLLPVLVNAPALSGLFNNDPMLQFSRLGLGLRGGLFAGPMSWFDPTVGYITEPIGHLVASDWLHGIIPWWNPYSGLGMPLAAEMQTAVFFLPFVLLLHFPAGWLLLRVLLQILCGLFAYAFFIELRLRRAAALLGAGLFALSPLFFLSPHAAIDPLPFLPLLLLGIERAARAARERRPLGWALVTIAAAYSILGGFPETALLDGLLAVVWTLWRATTLPPALWPRFFAKLIIALVIALCLCAPLLIPFLEYLPHANIGPHGGPLFSQLRLEPVLVPLQLFPFLYGYLGALPPDSLAAAFGNGWVRVPSWVGLPVLTLAIAALWRRGDGRQPRLVLLCWIILWQARYVGLAPATWFFNHVLQLGTADIIRFSGPMLAFTIFCLAAFGFHDYLDSGRLSAKRLAGTLGTVVLLLAAALLPVASYILSWWRQRPTDLFLCIIATVAVLAIVTVLCLELRRPRHRYILLSLLLSGPFLALLYPQFSGVRGGKLDNAPIAYLQAHAGMARIASLGPLDLNFPAAYRIASVEFASMPSPEALTAYIKAHLFGGSDLNIYSNATLDGRSFLLQHLAAYEAVGVGYIITTPTDQIDTAPLPLTALLKPTRAYALMPGRADLTGSLRLDLNSPMVKAVAIYFGTYRGIARGPLALTLCNASQCQSATQDTGKARDNAPLLFTFPAPLNIPPNTKISYRFHYAGGTFAGIWQVLGKNGLLLPSFAFFGPSGETIPGRVVDDLSLSLTPVFHDQSASIYRLADPAPYASTPGTDCRIVILSRTSLRTSCPAPARLRRLEMYFPGWSATVNGKSAQVGPDGIFQSVPLPQGAATVTFSYMPPHTRLGLLLAAGGLVLWLGLALASAAQRRRVTRRSP